MMKILIVEEEHRTRQAYSQLLRSRDVKVIEACGAWEASEIFTSERVDLVLMDLKLSDIASRDLLVLIQDYDPEIKVIIFGAKSVEHQKKIVPGADDYFDKLQSISVLLEKISNALSSKSNRKLTDY